MRVELLASIADRRLGLASLRSCDQDGFRRGVDLDPRVGNATNMGTHISCREPVTNRRLINPQQRGNPYYDRPGARDPLPRSSQLVQRAMFGVVVGGLDWPITVTI